MISPTLNYPALAIISLFALAAPSQTLAVTVSYDFEGMLSGHFEDLTAFGIDPLIQTGGTLVYHNDGVAGPDDTEGLMNTSFIPTYDQSWTASIDATIPVSYGSVTPGANAEDYLAVGISVFSPDTDYSFDGTMELGAAGRVYLSSYSDPGFYDSNQISTTDITGTITLEFDHTTKVMSMFGDGDVVFTADIDELGTDWGMSGSMPFTIAVFGTSEYEAIPSGDPLLLDNFEGITFNANSNPSVPEPSSLLLIAGVIALVARRRSRLCLTSR